MVRLPLPKAKVPASINKEYHYYTFVSYYRPHLISFFFLILGRSNPK